MHDMWLVKEKKGCCGLYVTIMDDEGGLPSLSLLAVVTMLGIVSVLRRR